MNNRFFWILTAGSLILLLTLGTRQSFGLYLAPASAELGWGREVFSLAIAMQNLMWGLTQPFVGALADRYGPGRTLVAGALLYALGLIIMGTAEHQLIFHIGTGLVIGLALSAVSFAVVFGAIARVAPPHRQGLALGIAGAAGSVGQLVIVLGNQALLEAEGWRTALLVGALVVSLIAALAYPMRGRRKPEPAAVTKMHPGGSAQPPGETLRQALRQALAHRGYWLLLAGFFVCGFHVTFIATHLPAYITDLNMSSQLAGTALAIIGGFNIIGSFACGALGDRYRKKHLLSLLYILRAGVIAGFVLAPASETSVLLFAAGIGLLWLGTVPLTSGLVAQIFGLKHMGMLFGIVFLSHQVGAFLGVWLGGKLYDASGSYDVVWTIAIVLGVLAAVLHWPIADRPVSRQALEETAGA
ncbi:MAG: MFS transporter [Alphaproteobacteria bacterium]